MSDIKKEADEFLDRHVVSGKTSTWFLEMHAAAKDSPEYKACMEELIKEEKILSELRGFIAIGADNWIVYLNINSIESIYKDEKTARCIVTTNSGETFMPTETPIEIMEQINKAKSAY
jgi:hypothetical protein